MPVNFDIIIVGAGLVGGSLALALDALGKRVAVVDKAPLVTGQTVATDPRAYAISPTNRLFLERLSLWPDASSVASVETMRIKGDRGSMLTFSHREVDVPALAWIVENCRLQDLLWERLLASSVTLFSNCDPLSIEQNASGVKLALDSEQVLSAQLLVGADGANSWVRNRLNWKVRSKSYQQFGVVANFACELPHANTAYQWFCGDSVLAWLPMSGQRVSVVWSTPDPDSALRLSDQALADVVAKLGEYTLGAFSPLASAVAFPLRLLCTGHTVMQRVVVVGDAAHNVHPLAGQGVNLGLRDVACLARLIEASADPGDYFVLRRYQRERREPVMVMQMACDALHRVFHEQRYTLASYWRNAGLTLVDRLLPLKRQLVRYVVDA